MTLKAYIEGLGGLIEELKEEDAKNQFEEMFEFEDGPVSAGADERDEILKGLKDKLESLSEIYEGHCTKLKNICRNFQTKKDYSQIKIFPGEVEKVFNETNELPLIFFVLNYQYKDLRNILTRCSKYFKEMIGELKPFDLYRFEVNVELMEITSNDNDSSGVVAAITSIASEEDAGLDKPSLEKLQGLRIICYTKDWFEHRDRQRIDLYTTYLVWPLPAIRKMFDSIAQNLLLEALFKLVSIRRSSLCVARFFEWLNRDLPVVHDLVDGSDINGLVDNRQYLAVLKAAASLSASEQVRKIVNKATSVVELKTFLELMQKSLAGQKDKSGALTKLSGGLAKAAQGDKKAQQHIVSAMAAIADVEYLLQLINAAYRDGVEFADAGERNPPEVAGMKNLMMKFRFLQVLYGVKAVDGKDHPFSGRVLPELMEHLLALGEEENKNDAIIEMGREMAFSINSMGRCLFHFERLFKQWQTDRAGLSAEEQTFFNAVLDNAVDVSSVDDKQQGVMVVASGPQSAVSSALVIVCKRAEETGQIKEQEGDRIKLLLLPAPKGSGVESAVTIEEVSGASLAEQVARLQKTVEALKAEVAAPKEEKTGACVKRSGSAPTLTMF